MSGILYFCQLWAVISNLTPFFHWLNYHVFVLRGTYPSPSYLSSLPRTIRYNSIWWHQKWIEFKLETDNGVTRIWGHWGGKIRFWGNKSPRIGRKLLILAIFSSDGGGASVGGQSAPLDAATGNRPSAALNTSEHDTRFKDLNET